MKIDFRVQDNEIVSVDIPEKIVLPEREELSVVPMVCGLVVGMVLPFGLMAFMKQMMSIEIVCGIWGSAYAISPVYVVCIVAILSAFMLFAWMIYVQWKKSIVVNRRKQQKQNMDFVVCLTSELFKKRISCQFAVPKPGVSKLGEGVDTNALDGSKLLKQYMTAYGTCQSMELSSTMAP